MNNMLLDKFVTSIVFIAIIWTMLPLFKHDVWWVRAFEFPRVQVAFLSFIILTIYIIVIGWQNVEDKLLIVALILCLAFQLIRIARYTPVFPRQLKSTTGSGSEEETLSLLVTNVLTPNRNADALLRLIRDRKPDIILAVETDDWWQSRLDILESTYPYSVKHPLDNLYGMHLYSRLKLINPEVHFLVEDNVPSIHTDAILPSGHQVEIHCLHPAPPSPTENLTSAERDAELLVVAKTIDSGKNSVVVMGDMNDVAWSASTRLFQNMSGLLDPRIGRGMYSTFNARYRFLRWPLDHVFCSSDFTLTSIERLDDIGSDHFPIHVVLQHTPEAINIHEKPEADMEDHNLAQKKIDKVSADEDALK